MHQPARAACPEGREHVPRPLDVHALDFGRRSVEAVERRDVDDGVAPAHRPLQPWAVAELDEVVPDLRAPLAQLPRDMSADEPGRTRDVDRHPAHD